ncbi:MAG: hypothetical protein K9M45_02900 [Kiritimatiellales bacterium]|nr:hypothetical protein [Kiritimatiellales bacterium]
MVRLLADVTLLVAAVIGTGLSSAEQDAVVLHQTFEDRAVGERCGWNDHSTIRGDSFAGVTGVTASPFNGGWHAYTFYRAHDQHNGWALLNIPPLRGAAVRFTVDLMVPADGGGSIALHNQQHGTWTALTFDGVNRELAVVTGRREQRALVVLEPHVWYRIILTASAVDASTFEVRILKHRGSAAPQESDFKDLPILRPGRAISRLKLSAESGKRFYYDNLKLEAIDRT